MSRQWIATEFERYGSTSDSKREFDRHALDDLLSAQAAIPVFSERVVAFTGQHLIAPQTVLREAYWAELAHSFEKRSLDIVHVLLHVDTEALTERIEADEIPIGVRRWRLDHIREYEKSRSWMESAADIVIDSTDEICTVAVIDRILSSSFSPTPRPGRNRQCWDRRYSREAERPEGSRNHGERPASNRQTRAEVPVDRIRDGLLRPCTAHTWRFGHVGHIRLPSDRQTR